MGTTISIFGLVPVVDRGRNYETDRYMHRVGNRQSRGVNNE